jgi:hypothetical protein
MKRKLFSLTLLFAILVFNLAYASDPMTGERAYLAEAHKIAAEIKGHTFVAWDETTYLRWQNTIFQIRNPLEYESTAVNEPGPSKSEILNSNKFRYNFSLVWEGVPILHLINEVL